MKKLIGGLVVLTIFAVVVGAAQTSPQLTPGQLKAAANAPRQDITSSAPRVVSPEEALAAASLPGAVTETARGVTPAQATVGLTKASAAQQAVAGVTLAAAAGAYTCWNWDPSYQWGWTPQQRILIEHRYWCAYLGGTIQYRTSSVRGSTTFCSWSNPYTYRYSGGVGYTWVKAQDGASYSCPSGIPWLTYNFDQWMRPSTNSWGNGSIEETN